MKSLKSLNHIVSTVQSCSLPLANRTGLVFGTALLGVLGHAVPAFAATINVTGAGDTVAADGICTLREAIQAANTDAAVNECTAGDGFDTINIPAATTINVGGTPLPTISTQMTINGGSRDTTIIDYNGNGGPGLLITAANSTVQNLTIQSVGPGAGAGSGAIIRVEAPNTTLDTLIVQDSSGPDRNGSGVFFNGTTSTAPTPPEATFGSRDVSGSVIRNSIVQNNDNGGITVRFGASGVTIDNNLVRVNGGTVPTNTIGTFGCAVNGTNRGGNADPRADGIELVGANNITATNNTIECNASYGIDLRTFENDNNTISNNTIRANGLGVSTDQDAGIGVRNGNDNTISTNTITANVNDGIVVSQGIGNRITQNSIFENGRNPTTGGIVNAADRLAIDLGVGDTGDGVTLNDNGDADGGPNERFNFPVFEAAIITDDNSQLILTGFTRPGAIIELFTVANPDPNNFGEAQTFLLTETEGGANDVTPGTGSYGPGIPPGYQTAQGQDTTNRFTSTNTRPGALAIGDVVTSTATNPVTLSTSELSGLITTTAGIGVAKQVVSVTPVSAGVFDVRFRLRVENLSSVALTNVQITDDLSTTFAGADSFQVLTTPPASAIDITDTNGDGTAAAENTNFDGVNPGGDVNLLAAGATLGPRILRSDTPSFIEVEYVVRVTPGTLLNYENIAVGTGNIGNTDVPLRDESNDGGTVVDNPNEDPTSPNNNTPTPITFGLELIKRITRVVQDGIETNFTTVTGNPPDDSFVGVETPPAPLDSLVSGNQVEYTIYFINRTGAAITDVSICDPVPENSSFAPNGFAEGEGISYAVPAAALGAGINQSNAADADAGEFLAALVANGACPNGNAGALGAAFVDVGTVDVDERGFVRFVTTVD
ncbi:MAG: right-handed parallel beta-helix repeat-containing protein [Cyanobacteria bacterium J06642_9]